MRFLQGWHGLQDLRINKCSTSLDSARRLEQEYTRCQFLTVHPLVMVEKCLQAFSGI